MSTNKLQTIAWHRSLFQIPCEWEITAYSIEPRQGRLEFATRYGPEALFAWQYAKRQPHPSDIWNNFPSLDGKRQPNESLATETIGRFTLAWGDSDQPCCAIAFYPELQQRLSWIFSRADPTVRTHIITPILLSQRLNNGAQRRWSAFGFDLSLPQDYRLEQVVARPADTELLFESDRRARLTLHRWGLPHMVLGEESLSNWYHRFLRARGALIQEQHPFTFNTFQGAKLRFSQRGEHQLDRFMGRTWEGGIAHIWHDTKAKRLYATSQIAPPRVEHLHLNSLFQF